MISCICQLCGNKFEAWPCRVKRSQAKFCSISCASKSRAGRRRKAKKTLLEKFWEKVDKLEEHTCWVWLGCLNIFGYGQFSIGKKHISAHHFSYIIHKGPIPTGLLVLHLCNNPTCVNPNHLKVGTQLENMQQCKADGRTAHGNKHGRRRLSESQVIEILKSVDLSSRDLSEKFGVSQAAIWDIISRRTWKYLDQKENN